MTKLIDAGRKELDEAKRMEIWHKLHQVIADEQPYTFLWITTARIFIQSRQKIPSLTNLGINTSDWYVPKDKQKYGKMSTRVRLTQAKYPAAFQQLKDFTAIPMAAYIFLKRFLSA